jgi:hypothetical protein
MAKKPLQTKAMNKAAAILGSSGGKKGGPARAKKLSAQRRSEIASKGAVARNTKYAKKDIAINTGRGKTNTMFQAKRRTP